MIIPLVRHNTGPICSHDESLNFFVHRFNHGSYKCRCGEVKVKSPEQIKADEQRFKVPNGRLVTL